MLKQAPSRLTIPSSQGFHEQEPFPSKTADPEAYKRQHSIFCFAILTSLYSAPACSRHLLRSFAVQRTLHPKPQARSMNGCWGLAPTFWLLPVVDLRGQKMQAPSQIERLRMARVSNHPITETPLWITEHSQSKSGDMCSSLGHGVFSGWRWLLLSLSAEELPERATFASWRFSFLTLTSLALLLLGEGRSKSIHTKSP